MNTEQEINNLKRQVQELIAWKEQRTRQQITFPLDKQSVEVLQKYVMRISGEYVYYGGAGGNPFVVYEGIQDKTRFNVDIAQIEYAADPSTDIIRILYPTNQSVFATDDTLVLFTTDTEPAGLSGGGVVTYYVVSAATDGASFKLSATLGGAAIDITSAGVGRQFLSRI